MQISRKDFKKYEQTKEKEHKKSIKEAFLNNYYESLEYINFLKKVSGIDMKIKKFAHKPFFIARKKLPSICFYEKNLAKVLKEQKIHFLMVEDKPNNSDLNQSILEYSLILKKSYIEAKKEYKRSFNDALKQSKRYKINTKIYKKPSKDCISQVYKFYKRQMIELNSFVLPKKMFFEFLKCFALRLFIVFKEFEIRDFKEDSLENNSQDLKKFEEKIIAYCLCFENSDNLYCSIGGSLKKYFNYKATNVLYDEIIKYGCSKELNIHLGLGQKGFGYSRFKENAGATNYRCNVFPDNTKVLNLYSKISKLKLTGLLLRIYSFLFPKKLIYMLIPMS